MIRAAGISFMATPATSAVGTAGGGTGTFIAPTFMVAASHAIPGNAVAGDAAGTVNGADYTIKAIHICPVGTRGGTWNAGSDLLLIQTVEASPLWHPLASRLAVGSTCYFGGNGGTQQAGGAADLTKVLKWGSNHIDEAFTSGGVPQFVVYGDPAAVGAIRGRGLSKPSLWRPKLFFTGLGRRTFRGHRARYLTANEASPGITGDSGTCAMSLAGDGTYNVEGFVASGADAYETLEGNTNQDGDNSLWATAPIALFRGALGAWVAATIAGGAAPNAPGMARGRGSVRGVMQERARG